MKSIHIDWASEWGKDKWDFVGRSALESIRGEWSEDNQDGINEDDGYPMMNYAYPLFSSEISEEKILDVCDNTSCTVVYNNEDDTYYLSLTGGGRDLSQDIALAYIIVDGCIDWDMLQDVYISGALSVSKENYFRILNELKRQLGIQIGNFQERLNRVNDLIKEKPV